MSISDNNNRKAKYTDSNKGVIYQSLDDLVAEAEEKGLDTDLYLHDCYIADESGFEGLYSEWLDWISL